MDEQKPGSVEETPVVNEAPTVIDSGNPVFQGSGAARGGRGSFAKVWEFVSELLHVVVISLAIIIPVRYFLIQPFYVKGASMEPNFHDHEYLIIDEISYRFGEPNRGDIVVFRYPNDPSQYFIKRIIGLPGDRVVISDGKVRLYDDQHPNGTTLDETSYLGPIFTAGDKDIQLGSDEYFLLGDNRGASLDSRSFGPVAGSFIVGRVWVRGWPPEKFRVFGEQNEIYQ
jgi:signal peptidase I